MWACSHLSQIVPMIVIWLVSPAWIAKPSVVAGAKLKPDSPGRLPAANAVLVAGGWPPKKRSGTGIPDPGAGGAPHRRRSDERGALAQLSAGRYSRTVVQAGLSGA